MKTSIEHAAAPTQGRSFPTEPASSDLARRYFEACELLRAHRAQVLALRAELGATICDERITDETGAGAVPKTEVPS